MRKKIAINNGIRRFISLALVLLTTFAGLSLFVDPASAIGSSHSIYGDIQAFDGTYSWETTLDPQSSSDDYITYTDYRENYCTAAATVAACIAAADGKIIRIDTAEELYWFSMDVSYEYIYQSDNPAENVKLSPEKIAVLLSLDYVLGNNIDYSEVGAKMFVPVGYAFYDSENVWHQNLFTGTFDGQGFVISNLYVAGYDYVTTTEMVDDEPVDLALSPYYTMFTINQGTICNLGLYDPTLELLDLHINITKVSNLVGLNEGVVDHVFVYDDRTDVLEAGIRYKVGTSSEDFEAAGIVHTNSGTFTNSYYVSKVVVNGSYINKFDSQPVLYANTGTIGNLVYDSDVYLLVVTVGTQTFTVATPNAYASGETTAVLKSTSSTLNQTANHWYFYPNDSYPLAQGLEYDDTNDVFVISDAIDMCVFSRLISFLSTYNGVTYGHSDYVLSNSIDMGTISPDAYMTPSATFYGSLSGYNASGSDLGDNYYIFNLNITEGTIRGGAYYAGLFSILGSGSVISDLNITQSEISLTDTEASYSKIFYVGILSGRLSAGLIEDVQTDADIDLGTNAIGMTYAGGLVGQASGTINRVSVSGTMDFNSHVYDSEYSVNPTFYIGGVIGGADAATLTAESLVNHSAIYGFGTASEFSLASGVSAIQVAVGGVVGYIYNTTSVYHNFVSIANFGDIFLDSVINTVGLPSSQKAGGVFGLLSGLSPVLESSGTYKFASFYNEGDINASYASGTSQIYAAGIGVSDSTEAVEYAMMYNHGAFSYNTTGASYSDQLFKYTGTIYDIGSYSVTLSRVYNYSNFTYASNYYTEISPLYYSENDNATLIRYSANYGNVYFMTSSATTTINLASGLSVSGITTCDNVSLQNVSNTGNITLVNVNTGSNTIHVSGMLCTLSDGDFIKNSLNKGNVVVADIAGSGNIFISGIVNTNDSGDLDDPEQSTTQPIATEGVINSINYGSIKTSYDVSHYGINGTGNTFIGGIATLNTGSIQDSANLGDIGAYNSSTSGTATFDTSTYYAGLVTGYTAGVVVGGIVGIVISGTSRIYDTANNGDIIAISYRFSRSGGILGVCLYDEADSGGITSGMGLTNDIEDSVLMNGLNFGDVSALTHIIGVYSTTLYSETFAMRYGSGSSYLSGQSISISTVVGSSERPQINASAGGVIGYGLSVMRNMLNHGTISSTDVAGGIVGATYVLGGAYSPYPVTYVDISTAINYGDIKAVPAANVMGSGSNVDPYLLSIADLVTFYMADGNSFIYPTTYSDRFSPGTKRGFGGIFGRLQRGTNGTMSSETGNFDFIVNANPNIDLIGRLDQVYNATSSTRYFRFNDAIYYSANINDTTQIVFTGFYYAQYIVTSVTGDSRNWDVTATIYRYEQVGIVATRSNPDVVYGTYTYHSNRTAPSIGTLLTSPAPYYIGGIEIPWITEDPYDANLTDPDTEYMYDPDFPMRTDPDLTEYIYYMEYNLLADRFKTTGDNPRPYGMYVLSTSAGSTYGAVLPSNISLDDMKPIDEDYSPGISLFVDYDNLSTIYTEDMPSEVVSAYNNLKQTIYNDKSEVIESETSEIVLTEASGGSDTVLDRASINYVSKRIDFTISLEAFLSAQSDVSYLITEIPTSAYALTAIRAYDYYGHTPSVSEMEAFNNLLSSEAGNGISISYPALLEVTLPSRTITTDVTLLLGYFAVYSEAFVGNDLFVGSAYYTEYSVYVTFTPTVAYSGGSIGITGVAFNGGGTIDASSTPGDVRSLGNVNSSGSISFIFTDTAGILTDGYDFADNFVLKYYDSSVISDEYYSLSSTPTVVSYGTGTYEISFTFYGNLRMGDYYLAYRYFPSSTEYTVYFDKSASSAKNIIGFTYYSEDDSLAINGLSITSDVNLGYTLAIDTSANNFTVNTDTGLAAYLSNVTYDISYMSLGSFEISPFASVSSARLVGYTYTNGYKDYEIEYVITAEDGSYSTYAHHIYERDIDFTAVLKNGNENDPGDVTAAREDELTTFSVDLGLDQSLDLYNLIVGSESYIAISLDATELDGLTPMDPAAIAGITYDASDYLMIYMSYETLPGIYTFSFVMYRDGTANYVTLSTSLVISKLEGVDPYLSDIKFSQLANETSYPDMSTANSTGQTNTDYYPVVYFAGIDYDGADAVYYEYFKIDGQVSNIPLEAYVPYMLDYLPYGATISRYAYETGTGWYWTAEVSTGASAEEEAVLRTNYTVFPDTGLEPGETEEVMILYRVTSEDGLHHAYYYITVTDIEFNTTFIFNVYYCTGATEDSCTLASQSVDFSDEMVIITVKNILTNGDDTVTGVDDPDDYPTFTTISGMQSKMTQFIYTYDGDYRYSFGRNRSGFFVFTVELPQDQYLNDLYTYEIKYDVYYLDNVSDYVSGIDGKYYYIGYSTRNRTRRFNVYIRDKDPVSTDKPWGLFDFFRSWGE